MFTSTRKKINVSSSKAIIDGISKDGGLYIVDRIPKVKIEELVNLNYKTLAVKILSLYLKDFSIESLEKIVSEAYAKFDIEEVVNLKEFGNFSFLELYHGPTLAFKDLALTVLPLLMNEAKKINNDKSKTIILTATSGDTGSAALSGFSTVDNSGIIVIYPNKGISQIQEKQILSFTNNQAKAFALEGNFDDAQNLVKKIFGGSEFLAALKNKNVSSANSINIGRLIPQIVYYFYSYIKLVKNKSVKLHDKINFCVPTGNFGNILAGYFASCMGLPVKRLICASNINNVLHDFFETGIYDKNRVLELTNSPSMDILISSNLERLLYYISGKKPNKVRELMDKLSTVGRYQISSSMKRRMKIFERGYADDKETLENIKEVFEKHQYLIDTHTAVGYKVYKDYQYRTNDNTKTVILSTASGFKFQDAVIEALGIKKGNSLVESLKSISDYTKIKIPSSLEKIANKEFIKNEISSKEAIDKIKKTIGDL
ncbi:MAG: threonine synthase [Bacilli bacterium]